MSNIIKYLGVELIRGTQYDHDEMWVYYKVFELIYKFDLDFMPNDMGINQEDGAISFVLYNPDNDVVLNEANFSPATVTFVKD